MNGIPSSLRWLVRATWSTALCAAVAGCGSGGALAPNPPGSPGTAGPEVAQWTTTGDRSRLLEAGSALAFAPAAAPLAQHVEVDASRRYQTMVGFGAAITDATAWLLRHRMSAAQRDALMAELFGRGPGGAGFDFTRLTIGASDFSTEHYTFNDRPPGQSDLELAHFSIEKHRADLLPVVKQALAVNPRLTIMASPWSAPAWMKTNDSLIKGSLRPDRYEVFSRYLVRYLESYAAEGVPIHALSLQNEPHFEPGDYPGMRLEAAGRAAIFGQHLGPMLERKGLKVMLIDWDHNWDEPASPLAVLADPVARRYVNGVGWHCYVAEHHLANQTVVHEAHPDKDTWFTECSGGEWKPVFAEALMATSRNIVIGSTRGWARGVLMWNLALDENHGPHLGGCKDCRGLVTIDSATGAVTRTAEYYALAHASRFVRPGAQRIESTGLTGSIRSVAFRNADDGSIVLVASNQATSEQRFSIGFEGRVVQASLPRESLSTFVWRP